VCLQLIRRLPEIKRQSIESRRWRVAETNFLGEAGSAEGCRKAGGTTRRAHYHQRRHGSASRISARCPRVLCKRANSNQFPRVFDSRPLRAEPPGIFCADIEPLLICAGGVRRVSQDCELAQIRAHPERPLPRSTFEAP
jgi:hypothetical protein